MYVPRNLEKVLKNRLFGGKVIILYGPRQAGKTTLIKHLTEDFSGQMRFIDCELIENKELLTRRNSADLFSLVEQYKVVVFDEAQTIPEIGSILKTLYDHRPEAQYIATGSSSFDLANVVSEPLTGRSLEFILYPLSLAELASNAFDAEQKVPDLMRFGGYPGLLGESEKEKMFRLKTLVSQYLYKNVLAVGGVKKPEIIIQLLKLLAYQMGNEVSYRELAGQLRTSQQTVERYINLLEKNFVIIRLGSFARNMRKEVTRSKKIYFVDMGIRNALVDIFGPIDSISRNDIGALFEGCMITERLKHLAHNGEILPNMYFWRTFTQQEIDYIEESQGKMRAYEFKWDSHKTKAAPKTFTAAYPQAQFEVISPRSAFQFVTAGSEV